VDGIFKLVSELRDSGVTILLVEQNVERALEIADRAYLLGKGEVIVEGPARELQEHVDITGAYLGGTHGPGREGG
jgi:branched-chain amino acid transport system ATP-binding protein